MVSRILWAMAGSGIVISACFAVIQAQGNRQNPNLQRSTPPATPTPAPPKRLTCADLENSPINEADVPNLARICKDLNGKTVKDIKPASPGGVPISWKFMEGQAKEISLHNRLSQESQELKITIGIITQDEAPSANRTWRAMRGELALYYMPIAGGWRLKQVNNISGKYSIHAPNDDELQPTLIDRAIPVNRKTQQNLDFDLNSKADLSVEVSVTGGNQDVDVRLVQTVSGTPVERYKMMTSRSVGGFKLAELDTGKYKIELSNSACCTDKVVTVKVTARYR